MYDKYCKLHVLTFSSSCSDLFSTTARTLIVINCTAYRNITNLTAAMFHVSTWLWRDSNPDTERAVVQLDWTGLVSMHEWPLARSTWCTTNSANEWTTTWVCNYLNDHIKGQVNKRGTLPYLYWLPWVIFGFYWWRWGYVALCEYMTRGKAAYWD